MHLDRPLVFFDLETTGLDAEADRIIEIACIKVFPDRRPQERLEALINPGRPIPPEVIEITGITNEMVQDAQPFAQIVPSLSELIRDADLGGYNAGSFDVPFLEATYRRSGVVMPGPADRAVIDPLEILKKMESRSLSWAYEFYLDKPFEGAHRALQDIEATMDVLRVQVGKYGLKGTVQDIQKEIRKPFLDARRRLKWQGNKVVINFGKYRGKALDYVRRVDPDYLSWMRENFGMEVATLLDEHAGG